MPRLCWNVGDWKRSPRSSKFFGLSCRQSRPKSNYIRGTSHISENRHSDPSRPTRGWRTAWRHALKRAGFHCRFHDLRLTCTTKLSESQASEMTIMAIAGHVSRRMLEHYSRIRTAAKRAALDAIVAPVFQVSVHQNVHQVSATDSDRTAKLLN
jgi:integrase